MIHVVDAIFPLIFVKKHKDLTGYKIAAHGLRIMEVAAPQDRKMYSNRKVTSISKMCYDSKM